MDVLRVPGAGGERSAAAACAECALRGLSLPANLLAVELMGCIWRRICPHHIGYVPILVLAHRKLPRKCTEQSNSLGSVKRLESGKQACT